MSDAKAANVLADVIKSLSTLGDVERRRVYESVGVYFEMLKPRVTRSGPTHRGPVKSDAPF